MGAPTYADLNKPLKNVLHTGYGTSAHTAELKMPYEAAAVTTKLERAPGAAAPKASITADYFEKNTGALLTVAVGTDNSVEVGVKKSNWIAGVTTGVKVQQTLQVPGSDKWTSSLDYVNKDLGFSVAGDLVCAKGVCSDVACFYLARGPVEAAAEFDVDVNNKVLRKYNIGLAYKPGNFSVVTQLKDNASTTSVGVAYPLSPTNVFAFETTYGLNTGRVGLTVGGALEYDKDTVLRSKATIDEKQVFSASVARRLTRGVKVTVASEVNVKDFSSFKYGIGLVLDDAL